MSRRMTAFMKGAAKIQGLWRGRLDWSFMCRDWSRKTPLLQGV
jgi:hypothetical protein